MPALKISELVTAMANAAKTSFASKWPAIKDLATTSLKSIAQNLIDIEKMRLQPSPSITQEQAKLLVHMQVNTLKIVLLSEEGLGLLAVEAAINAALDAVKTAVNTAIGFAIL